MGLVALPMRLNVEHSYRPHHAVQNEPPKHSVGGKQYGKNNEQNRQWKK